MDMPTILIADESPDQPSVTFLEREGYRVETVSSHAAAVQRLQAGAIDLVLVDVSLFEHDSRTLVSLGRTLVHPPEFIVLATSAQRELASQSLLHGALCSLQKPMDNVELLRCVKMFLERRELLASKQRLSDQNRLLRSAYSFFSILEVAPFLEQAVAMIGQELGAKASFAFVREAEVFVPHALQGLDYEQAQRLASLLSPRLTCGDQGLSIDVRKDKELEPYRQVVAYPLCSKNVLEGGLVFLDPEVTALDPDRSGFVCRQAAVAFNTVLRLRSANELMYTDDLTGLYNYRYLQFMLEQELRRSGRYGLEFGLVFIDLDFFKGVNDRHGHLVGSAILCEVGRVLRDCVRDTDLLFRYGGDEFTALLVETDERGTQYVAERIRATLESHEFLAEKGINARLTATIGVAVFPTDAEERMELLNLADRAMYLGKQKRNVVRSARDILGQ